MSSKPIAIALAALLVLTNAWWAWQSLNAALSADGIEQQAAANAEVTRVMITLANHPLEATTAAAAVTELQQRLPDVLVKANADTVEVSDLVLVFGSNGLHSIRPM